MAASHPFYRRLNQLLREHGFDDFAEAQCADFYTETMGRPGLPPGIYFRLLLIGYFEGIDAERGIAWRAADLLALRDFLRVGPKEEGLERRLDASARSRRQDYEDEGRSDASGAQGGARDRSRHGRDRRRHGARRRRRRHDDDSTDAARSR